MRSAAIVVAVIVGLAVVVGFVMRARAHRALTTEEIVQLTKQLHAQTGVDPMKPQGFTVQPDGTWVPIERDKLKK